MNLKIKSYAKRSRACLDKCAKSAPSELHSPWMGMHQDDEHAHSPSNASTLPMCPETERSGLTNKVDPLMTSFVLMHSRLQPWIEHEFLNGLRAVSEVFADSKMKRATACTGTTPPQISLLNVVTFA
jgi:hypothetical protein